MAKQRRRPVRRRDRKGGPTSGRRKPCPYCRDKIDQVDYKDVSRAAPVHLRARQDPLPADHRRLPPSPEPGRTRRQACTRGCAAALCRREAAASGASVAAVTAATATATASRRASTVPQAILLQDVETLGERGTVVDVSAGLPAQLPAAAQARRARHQGFHRGGQAARGTRRARQATRSNVPARAGAQVVGDQRGGAGHDLVRRRGRDDHELDLLGADAGAFQRLTRRRGGVGLQPLVGVAWCRDSIPVRREIQPGASSSRASISALGRTPSGRLGADRNGHGAGASATASLRIPAWAEGRA